VHAVLHTLSAIVRRPFPGRFQPYLAGGYGMVLVFPGQSINASPVTKNALALGGGLEFYIRSDLAIRADVRRATVFGRQRDQEGIVAYEYLQETIGLSFYRSIRP
jgi:opacity protein-like surface antigen